MLPAQFKALLFPDLPPVPNHAATSAESDTIKMCKRCFTELARGKRHNCTKSEMRENLAGIVKSRSKKSKEKVVASSLKSIFNDQGVDQRGGTVSLPTGGPPVQVTLARKLTKKSPRWSHESLKRLQAAMNLSDRAIKYVTNWTYKYLILNLQEVLHSK